jgi:hypothetical protein
MATVTVNVQANTGEATQDINKLDASLNQAEQSADGLSNSLEQQEARIKTLGGAINLVGGSVEVLAGSLAVTGALTEEQAEQFQTAAIGAIAFADGAKRIQEGYVELNEGLKNYGGVAGVATKAQKALNAAFRANPIGLVVTALALLTAGVYAYIKATDTEAKERRERLKKIEEEAKAIEDLRIAQASGAAGEKVAIESLVEVLDSENTSLEAKRGAYEELKKVIPDLADLTYEQAVEEDALADAIQRQITLIELRAKARALEDYLVEQEKARLEAEELARIEKERFDELQRGIDLQQEYDMARKGGFAGTIEEFQQTMEAQRAFGNELAGVTEEVEEQNPVLSELAALQARIAELTQTQTTNVRKRTEATEDANEADAEALRLQQALAAQAESDANMAITMGERLDAIFKESLSAQQQELNAVEDKYFDLLEFYKDDAEVYALLAEQKRKEEQAINKKYDDLYEQSLDKRSKAEKFFASEQAEAIGASLSVATDLVRTFSENIDESSKEGFEKSKKYKIAETRIASLQAAFSAYGSLVGVPFVGPILGVAAAAAALAAGQKAINDIQSSTFGGGGGLSNPAAGAGGTPSSASTGGASGGGGGVPQIPGFGTSGVTTLNAVVLAGDVTSAQAQDAAIRNRRRFGRGG